MPRVLPSAEKEWQFAHVGIPARITLLSGSERSRSRHSISGMASLASGLMTPVSPRLGISGTSR